MRYLLPTTVLAGAGLALTLCGCGEERQTYTVVPDRQGHATAPEGTSPNISDKPVAGVGEMYYSVEQNDTLVSIARKFNIKLEDLIRRNDIQHKDEVRPGRQLIVPQMPTTTAPRGEPDATR